MRTIEFCYWLQGPFEWAGVTELTEKQVTCIKQHLDLTFVTNPEGGPFVHWLRGALDGRTTLDERQTTILREKLNQVFIHVIDPSYTDDPEKQQEMQDAHDGVKPEKPQRPRRDRPPGGLGRSSSPTRFMC